MKVALLPSNQVNNAYAGAQTDESAVMFEVAQRCAEELKRLGYRARVFHEMGGIIGLREMVKQANAWGADLAISPHSDAIGDLHKTGILGIVYDRDRVSLGATIAEGLADYLNFTKRGVWTRPNLMVLRATTMPSVLVEIGEHATEKEAKWLIDHRKHIGIMLAWAIDDATEQEDRVGNVKIMEKLNQLIDKLGQIARKIDEMYRDIKALRKSATASSYRESIMIAQANDDPEEVDRLAKAAEKDGIVTGYRSDR